MVDWKSALKANPVNWLLEKDGPSVQYFTLTDILERPESAHEVCEAKKQSPITPVGRGLMKPFQRGYCPRESS